MSNTVTVACSHPQGFVCELGLVLDYAAQRFVKKPAYKRVVLRGSQRSTIVRVGGPENFKAARGLEPGLTEVPEDFITEWLRQHPKLSQYVWIVEKPAADLKHQVGDRPTPPFEPMDRAKPVTLGLDTIERADFSK